MACLIGKQAGLKVQSSPFIEYVWKIERHVKNSECASCAWRNYALLKSCQRFDATLTGSA
ncbi:hypothetical protein SAMN04487969_10499 [Paenibacillus algorifonticola]|uniref:Uncharacterized protein n=1 Tax=Paenibacillus algorifonticola TaxID=684063 RepID=A0A1I2BVC6_9BACL|nr:hypothetical protein SAMN04487969_10499 [Paenibacillus algorifonticola]